MARTPWGDEWCSCAWATSDLAASVSKAPPPVSQLHSRVSPNLFPSASRWRVPSAGAQAHAGTNEQPYP